MSKAMRIAKKTSQTTAEQTSTYRDTFVSLEPYWTTVRAGYLREMPVSVKQQIEAIFRAEIDPGYIPNQYCKGCYFEAIERLIKFYGL